MKEEPVINAVRNRAATLFNRVWELLDKGAGRSALEVREMVHAAHASRALWEVAGGAREGSIGEWQIARVYAELGDGGASMYHALLAVGLAEGDGEGQGEGGDIGAFLRASAREGAARAAVVLGDAAAFDEHAARSREHAAGIEDAEERELWAADFGALERPGG